MTMLASPEQAPLDITAITPLIAGCNTEFKCALLEPLACQVGTPMSERLLFDATLLGNVDPLFQRKLTPNNAATALASLPPGLVTIDNNPVTGRREFTLSKAGLLCAAIGGHLLRISESSSKSIRLLTGEYAGDTSKHGHMNALEARLIVLTGLYRNARTRWQPSGGLYDGFKEHGLHEPPAAGNLKRLGKAGFVETKKVGEKNGYTQNYHRIKQADPTMYYDPAEVIYEYLNIVGKVAVMDIDFLNVGLDHLSRICHDEVRFPLMVKRSFASTQHTKESNLRVAPTSNTGVLGQRPHLHIVR